MFDNFLKEKIYKTDWSSFSGPLGYDFKKVSPALVSLMEIESSQQTQDVTNQLISALGNNHAGVYYPVVIGALDYIIEIAKTTDSSPCRMCALSFLNNLYYFEPDASEYSDCTSEFLKGYVQDKLLPYSDELFAETVKQFMRSS
jgi:hypothetical protein